MNRTPARQAGAVPPNQNDNYFLSLKSARNIVEGEYLFHYGLRHWFGEEDKIIKVKVARPLPAQLPGNHPKILITGTNLFKRSDLFSHEYRVETLLKRSIILLNLERLSSRESTSTRWSWSPPTTVWLETAWIELCQRVPTPRRM